MAKKILGHVIYSKEPRFPSYGGDEIYGSYDADQSFAVDTRVSITQTDFEILKRKYEDLQFQYNKTYHDYLEIRHDKLLARQAPSYQQLDESPALKAAWEQYIIVRNLVTDLVE
jgi:hypothetical protein